MCYHSPRCSGKPSGPFPADCPAVGHPQEGRSLSHCGSGLGSTQIPRFAFSFIFALSFYSFNYPIGALKDRKQITDCPNFNNAATAMKVYGRSKLCNLLFTHELAKRLIYSPITVNCVHPGAVDTELQRDAPSTTFPHLLPIPLCTTQPDFTLHYTTLHYTTLHYTTLHLPLRDDTNFVVLLKNTWHGLLLCFLGISS